MILLLMIMGGGLGVISCSRKGNGPECRTLKPVWLNPPYQVTTRSVTLEWSGSSLSEGNYVVFRDSIASVNLQSRLIKSILIKTTLDTLVDTSLLPNTQYYYRVYTQNTCNEFSAGSNIQSVTTKSSQIRILTFKTSQTQVDLFSNFKLTCEVNNVDYLYGISLDIEYDQNLIQFQTFQNGGFLQGLFLTKTDTLTGVARVLTAVALTDSNGNSGISGSGNLGDLSFKSLSVGSAILDVKNITVIYRPKGSLESFVRFNQGYFDSVVTLKLTVNIK